MAPSEKQEPDNFLTTLDTRISVLQSLRDMYVKALTMGALQPGGDVAGFDLLQLGAPKSEGAAYELPTGALLGKSVPAAIKLYLGAVKKKQTPKEIANALRDGGIESTAASFENNVTSALHRLRSAGEVLQFKDGWALAEFYPANLRNRIAEDKAQSTAKKRSNAKKAKTGPAPTAKRAPVKAHSKRRVSSNGPSIDERIAAYFRAHIGHRFSPRQVGDALHETDVKIVAMAFARLARYGKVAKGDDGLYAAA